MHAWCIPASGKDYEVTDKDVVEVSALKGEIDSLITDARAKVLEVPAADPGNIVGFEYVEDMHPLVLQDVWDFQETVPVRESHYSLTLPAAGSTKMSGPIIPKPKSTMPAAACGSGRLET